MKKRSKQKSGSASSADKETSAVRIRDLELENESLKRVIVELRTTLNDSKNPVSSPKIAELKKLAPYVFNTTLAPILGRPLNPQAASEAEIILSSSLSKLESVWLKGNERFLLGGNQPSIADLSLVCEIMQLEIVDEKDRARLLGPHKKVQQWIENTRKATSPHFDEVHKVLMKAKENLQNQRLKAAKKEGGSDMKKPLVSRM